MTKVDPWEYLEGLAPGQRLLLLGLHYLGASTDWVQVTVADLSALTGSKRSTTLASIQSLKRQGLLDVNDETRFQHDGNSYRLRFRGTRHDQDA